MRGPFLASLLILTVLAGCLDDEPAPEAAEEPPQARVDPGPGFVVDAVDHLGLPVPKALCFSLAEFDVKAEPDQVARGERCNFEMTPDEGREGNEVTIAVNPRDPQNIVGGAKDYYPPDAGDCVWDGVYVTHDGGRSIYQDRSFDGSPWRLYNGDVGGFTPNYASSFWCTTDPVAYFNTAGDLYYLLMAYQTDPVTGSKACEEECPNGALNDWAFNRATQIVAISSDGGDTFHTFTPVLEGTFPINFHDKGWVAASADGTVHVMWWAAFLPGNLYFRSTDGGQTYTEPEVLSILVGPDVACNAANLGDCPDVPSVGPAPGVGTSSAGQGSFVDVGTGPEVYAIWYNGGIVMRRSMDHGETWDPARDVLDTNPQSMPGLSPRDRRTGFPAFATDRNEDSPYADAIYMVWNDKCQDPVWKPEEQCEALGPNSIYFAASFDKGETFTEPIRISDDTNPNGTLATEDWSIFPAVSVSPGGVIDVSWMDTRGARLIEDAENGDHLAFEQYYTYSVDGGKTWSQNVNIRDADDQGWDPAMCHHQNGMIFLGDYNDIDSSWQAAHPVWPDTRAGVCDVYTATIQRPAFAEGWDADARAEAEQFIRDNPL